jgi:tripartite-type tricarboxylate transporter receptor subunit TctC
MMFDAVTVMNEHVKAGKVRALATSGVKRSNVMPDIPTLAEAGVPGYDAVIWLGLIAPRGTPAAIVNRLNAEVTKIVARPDVQAEWGKQGAVAMTMSPDAFERYVAADIVKWERIVKLSGARADR